MEHEIRPEPTPDERAAILAALERAEPGGHREAHHSAWQEEGIRENVADLEEDQLG
ncbi:MAG: hypothetical protein WBB76_11440 [Gaiellaceae bacterium]